MSTPIKLTLVRHGETTGRSHIRLNGVTDVPLSDLGRAQMERVAQALTAERFDRVISSDLRRSIESAQIISGRAPEIVPELRELDFGAWETLTWAEVEARDPKRLAECRLDALEFQFPGGDSRQGFVDRVSGAARRVFRPAPGHTLAALHKGVCKVTIGALCGSALGAWRALPCDLGCVHQLIWADGAWRLTAQNEVAHLGELWMPDHPA